MSRTIAIALDIDGTLIQKHMPISMNVKAFLFSLEKSGYKIMFMTGRSYHFAKKALHPFDFKYFLGVQNGAEILSMPDHEIFHQALMDVSVIAYLEKAYENIEGDFLVYAGYEKGDFCYFRPDNFSEKELEYIAFLRTLTPISWMALKSFDALPQDKIPLIKCLGSRKDMQNIKDFLSGYDELRVCLIDDRESDNSILLITQKEATKGAAIQKLKDLGQITGPVIAAGDDMNDLSMFDVADICVAMQDGADELKKKADIIAPPASQEGIIQGIQEALDSIDA